MLDHDLLIRLKPRRKLPLSERLGIVGGCVGVFSLLVTTLIWLSAREQAISTDRQVKVAADSLAFQEEQYRQQRADSAKQVMEQREAAESQRREQTELLRKSQDETERSVRAGETSAQALIKTLTEQQHEFAELQTPSITIVSAGLITRPSEGQRLQGQVILQNSGKTTIGFVRSYQKLVMARRVGRGDDLEFDDPNGPDDARLKKLPSVGPNGVIPITFYFLQPLPKETVDQIFSRDITIYVFGTLFFKGKESDKWEPPLLYCVYYSSGTESNKMSNCSDHNGPGSLSVMRQ